MSRTRQFSISLPSREEIQSTKESVIRGKPNLLRKIIRYRNGLKITLIQNFEENIFSVRIKADHDLFRMIGDRLLSIKR